MSQNKRSKISTILIVITTLVLAGIAIFTAIKLYKLRNQAVAPTAPTSKPKAQEEPTEDPCAFNFNIATPTATPVETPTTTPVPTGTSVTGPTATPTRTPTATPVRTATPTSVPQCNSSCTSNSQCSSNLICYIPSGQTTGNCRNTSCLTESDCTCAISATSTPTPVPALPDAGTSWPTIAGSVFGIIVVAISLILAL